MIGVARPRVHDVEALLDAGDALVAEGGTQALTIRALAERTGAPSGSLYHAFGSRDELLARMWLRAANRFLELQRGAVNEHLEAGHAIEATIAAASMPAVLARSAPASAKVLFGQRPEAIIADGLPDALVAELKALDDQLVAVMRLLADALFDRHDRKAVEIVAICIVDLPTGLLLGRHERAIDAVVVLEAAIRGVLVNADGFLAR